jgi:hypothetical protein
VARRLLVIGTMTKRPRPQTLRSSPLSTKALAAVCGGGITHVDLKRGQFDAAPLADEGIKVFIDVVY